MYLKYLTTEEKNMFINLTVHAAKANGVVEDEEIYLMGEYCKEMGIEFDWEKSDVSMKEITEVIKKSSMNHKKIMIFELIGFMYAEGEFDRDEKIFVLNFSNNIGMEKEKLAELIAVVSKYVKVVNDISEIVLK